ncbi:MAG: BatD family protein [Methanosarcina sp.]|nr:BatD family protein [Methanosarcina sp.]MDD3316793.1 BatD family protein [Methanosarcina sp.]MDD4305584.1 BatD family protein [Methanosarcina sp.]MDD4620511.1 BatD family protein [Methanosarcina sp.]
MAKNFVLIVLLAVFSFSVLSMTTLAEENIEWVKKQEGKKLYWGDTVTVDGYVIKAEDFNVDKCVFISISKDGEKLKTAPLSAGLDVVYNDRIKVYAQKVDPNYETITKDGKEFKRSNWNPYAELNIFVRGEPNFDIKVETQKDAYDPKSTERIDVSIKLKNDGQSKAKDTILTIDTAGMEILKGKARYTFGEVLKDETLEPMNLTLKPSAHWVDTDLKITAKTTCVDVKGDKYEDTGSKVIKIEKIWGLIISKSIKKDYHMGKPVHVLVSVRNEGLCDINDIIIKDSVVSDMHLQKAATFEKTLSLKSGETAGKVFEYTLIPEKPGEFTIPQAIATFTLPNGQSGETCSDCSENVKIYGPEISITKTVDRQQLNSGDKLTVTVTAKNTGNIDASVTLTDTIPPEAKFISGETSFKQVLRSAGGSKTIVYVMQMHKEGEINLPACKATFIDIDEYSGEVFSDTPVIYVGIPIPLEGNSTQSEGVTESNQEKDGSSSSHTEEDSEETSGFGTILTITGLLMVTGFLGKRRT